MTIRFHCSCGNQLQAEKEFAGRRIQCPACTQMVAIPAQATLGAEAVTFSPPLAPGNPPARPPGISPSADISTRCHPLWPWLALLLLFAGGGAAVWYFVLREQPAVSEGDIKRAQKKPDPQEHPLSDLDFIPADGPGFISFQVGSWWNSEGGIKLRQELARLNLAASFEKSLGVFPADIQRVLWGVPSVGQADFWVVISTSKPYDQARVLAGFAPGTEVRAARNQKIHYYPKYKAAVHFASQRIFLVGTLPALQKVLETGPARKGPLSEALGLADHHLLVVAINLTRPEVRKDFQLHAASPEAKPFRPLLEIQQLVLTTDLAEDLQIDLRLIFSDESRAEKARATVVPALALLEQKVHELLKTPLVQEETARPLAHLVSSLLHSVEVEREKNVVHLRLQTEKATVTRALAAFAPVMDQVATAGFRTQSQNNLKQLAQAMHNYAADHGGSFPPAVFHKGLSWRVALLPYLEQDALYRKFHLDEPWDSPHNHKLLALMPKVFVLPAMKANHPKQTTCYKVFAGPQAPFQGSKAPALREFTDGLSTTFLIVEAGEFVPWTKPADLPHDPKGKLPALQPYYSGGFYAAMGDGSVRWVSDKVSETTLRAAITPAGGDNLGADWNP